MIEIMQQKGGLHERLLAVASGATERGVYLPVESSWHKYEHFLSAFKDIELVGHAMDSQYGFVPFLIQHLRHFSLDGETAFQISRSDERKAHDAALIRIS